MIAFFILGGAALLLLVKPGLFSAGRDEGLLDLGFMQPGEPERHPVLGGAGASTGTDHDTSHKTTMQDMSVEEHLKQQSNEEDQRLERLTEDGHNPVSYETNLAKPLSVEGVVQHQRNWQLD